MNQAPPPVFDRMPAAAPVVVNSTLLPRAPARGTCLPMRPSPRGTSSAG